MPPAILAVVLTGPVGEGAADAVEALDLRVAEGGDHVVGAHRGADAGEVERHLARGEGGRLDGSPCPLAGSFLNSPSRVAFSASSDTMRRPRNGLVTTFQPRPSGRFRRSAWPGSPAVAAVERHHGGVGAAALHPVLEVGILADHADRPLAVSIGVNSAAPVLTKAVMKSRTMLRTMKSGDSVAPARRAFAGAARTGSACRRCPGRARGTPHQFRVVDLDGFLHAVAEGPACRHLRNRRLDEVDQSPPDR
jgi:hypothetical protein